MIRFSECKHIPPVMGEAYLSEENSPPAGKNISERVGKRID
jgi:hypothetical protein